MAAFVSGSRSCRTPYINMMWSTEAALDSKVQTVRMHRYCLIAEKVCHDYNTECSRKQHDGHSYEESTFLERREGPFGRRFTLLR